MSQAGVLRRLDHRYVPWAEKRLGSGPMAGAKGAAVGSGIALLLLAVGLLLAGRSDLLWVLAMPALGSGLGLLIVYVMGLGKALKDLTAEVSELRAELASQTTR